jgi:GT2 family glycosyltransferase
MIAIVLVNYNGWRDTVECLESLLKMAGDQWRIIVVDNNSADNSFDHIQRWAADREEKRSDQASVDQEPLPQARPWAFRTLSREQSEMSRPELGITLIQAGANLGFAGGNNVGIRHALRASDCSHVWLLNNDTVVDHDAGLALLRRINEDQGVGMVGSTLIYYHRPETLQGVGGVYKVKTASGYQIGHLRSVKDLPPRDEVEAQMSYVIGASMMVSRRFLDDVGLMSERYFLYYEELDWTIRATGKYRMAWAPDSLVYHKEGGSIGTSTLARPSTTSTYYMARSTILFYAAHYPILLPVALGRLGLRAARFVYERDWRSLQAIGRAIASLTSNGQNRARSAS